MENALKMRLYQCFYSLLVRTSLFIMYNVQDSDVQSSKHFFYLLGERRMPFVYVFQKTLFLGTKGKNMCESYCSLAAFPGSCVCTKCKVVA